jgi:hypothetical protein
MNNCDEMAAFFNSVEMVYLTRIFHCELSIGIPLTNHGRTPTSAHLSNGTSTHGLAATTLNFSFTEKRLREQQDTCAASIIIIALKR